MVPFEDGVGMEAEHTPEIDVTRYHQIFEEGDKFESSILRLDRCFSALLRKVTHLLRALWNELKCPSAGFAFQEEKGSRFKATASP